MHIIHDCGSGLGGTRCRGALVSSLPVAMAKCDVVDMLRRSCCSGPVGVAAASCPTIVVGGALILRRAAGSGPALFGTACLPGSPVCRCRLLSTAAEVRGLGREVFSFGLSTELSRLLVSSFRLVVITSSVTCIGVSNCSAGGACLPVTTVCCGGRSHCMRPAVAMPRVHCDIVVAVGGIVVVGGPSPMHWSAAGMNP